MKSKMIKKRKKNKMAIFRSVLQLPDKTKKKKLISIVWWNLNIIGNSILENNFEDLNLS